MVIFALPTLLHEDERYYAKGEGGIFKRGIYAATRVLITPNYKGHNTLNISELLGELRRRRFPCRIIRARTAPPVRSRRNTRMPSAGMLSPILFESSGRTSPRISCTAIHSLRERLTENIAGKVPRAVAAKRASFAALIQDFDPHRSVGGAPFRFPPRKKRASDKLCRPGRGCR